MLRNLFILFLTSITAFPLQSASIEFDSNISNVMIYRSGVRITRDAQINIPAGQSEIIFSNLTTQINTHSLQAYVPEGVELQTVHYKTNFLKNIELPALAKTITEEMEALNLELDWNRKQLSVYTEEEKILKPKQVELNSDDKGISVQDLITYTAFFREQSLEIKKKLFDLGKENKKIKSRLAVLQAELNEMQSKQNLKTGEVIFIVNSTVARQCELSFSYISNQAGWVPVYDIKAMDTQSPLALNLKANIYQNTGIDWDGIKMSVSTGNPLIGNDRPILRPKYITYAPTVRAPIFDQTTTSNMALKMEKKDKSYAEDLELNNEFVNQIEDTETTREYVINTKQSVPSSGLKRLVQLHRYDIDAEYKYHCVPKMDCGVFLLAEVSNWGQYNLLPGTANIFFQNTYIGQSVINSNVAADKLLLSLGRDESIKVERERINYMEEKLFLGLNEIKNMEYRITVKNTKGKDINIEILDQIPVSQHEDIEIELVNSSDAEFEAAFGGLKWELDLAPGASSEIEFKYTQKTPRKLAAMVN